MIRISLTLVLGIGTVLELDKLINQLIKFKVMKIKIVVVLTALSFFAFSNVKAQGHGHIRGNGHMKYVKMYKHHRDRDYSDWNQAVYMERYHHSYYNPYRPQLPPGHAKKLYGYKSARAFAPGQQKKAYYRNGYYPQRRPVYNGYDDGYGY